MRLRRAALCAVLPLALAACSAGGPAASPAATGGGTTPSADAAPVAVATTTQLGSILGDITECAGTTSATLMGPGDDPHDFSVASSEVATLVKAKLVVTNGLTLEGGLASTLEGAKKDGATIFEVAPQLDPLSFEQIEEKQARDHAGHTHEHAEEGHDHGAEGHEGHNHGAYDPHVHMDVKRMSKAAGLIGAELAKVTGDAKYGTCGQEVQAKLEKTDAEVRQILSTIPEAKRVLVTDHEAYNYFADAYDFRVAGVVIPGGSTDAEPSSADLAELVEVIKEDKVDVLISNNTVSPKLIEAIAKEAGTNVRVVQLYEGSVGPAGSGADTYEGMMLTDARLLADALK